MEAVNSIVSSFKELANQKESLDKLMPLLSEQQRNTINQFKKSMSENVKNKKMDDVVNNYKDLSKFIETFANDSKPTNK